MSDIPGDYPFDIPLDRIDADGPTVDIAYAAEARQGLADRLDVTAINAVTADLTLRLVGAGVEVSGRVIADIVQPCVVTGADVRQAVAERVRLLLLPADDLARAGVDLDPDDDWDSEPLTGSGVRLADYIEEAVVLGLDPYPRAPDAVWEPPGESPADGDATDGPFAKLAALKAKTDGLA